MRITALLLAAALPLCAADDPPTTGEWVAEGVCLAIQAADWGMTLNMVDRTNAELAAHRYSDQPYNGFKEQNLILPRHPSRAQINTLCALGMVIQFIAFRYAPRDLRRVMLTAEILIQGAVVRSNARLGLRVRF